MIKKTKISLILVLISFIAVNTSFASTNSAAFLKIKSDARSVAMGGVSCAISEGISSIETNPAGLIHLSYNETNEVMAAHNEWFEDIRGEYISYGRPIGYASAIGISLKYIYMNDLVRRDIYGDEYGTFGANNGVATISAAQEIWENISAGVSLKAISEKIDDKSDTTFGFDIGFLYMLDTINIGASVQNIGRGIKLNEERFGLPLIMTIGVSSEVVENGTVGLDIENEKGRSVLIRLGGEYKLIDIVALRAGYSYTEDERADNGLTAGLGFKVGLFDIDYGFVPFGDLGDTHRVSLKITW